MKSESTSSSGKTTAHTAAVLLLPIMSAMQFTFMGAILGGFFGEWFKPLIGFHPEWWQGAIVGLGIGLPVGIVQARNSVRRSQQMEATFESLGLIPLTEDDRHQLQQRLRRVINRRIQLDDCYFRSTENAILVVAELTIVRESTSSNSNSPDLIQTCICLQTANITFPKFLLQPEGFFVNLLQSGSDIDFDDSPEFSRQYHLSAQSENDVRKLFDKVVRDHFEQNSGLQVVGSEHHLVIYKPKRLCQPDQLNFFISTALKCLGALSATGSTIEPELGPPQPVTKRAAIQQAAAIGGIAGSLVQRRIESTLIDNAELQEFLKRPIPRQIPKELQNRFAADPMLKYVSLLFATAGIGVAIVGALIDVERPIVRVLPVGIGLIAFSIFAIVLYFVSKGVTAKMRVLGNGEIVSGTVTKVVETGTVIGNERVYEVRFQPGDDSASSVGTKIRGCHIDRAFQLCESGDSTVLLRDPTDPKNTLLIECYVI